MERITNMYIYFVIYKCSAYILLFRDRKMGLKLSIGSINAMVSHLV